MDPQDHFIHPMSRVVKQKSPLLLWRKRRITCCEMSQNVPSALVPPPHTQAPGGSRARGFGQSLTPDSQFPISLHGSQNSVVRAEFPPEVTEWRRNAHESDP